MVCFTCELLFERCLIQTFFFSSFLFACMIVAALTLKACLNPEVLRGKKNKRWGSEKQGSGWVDGWRKTVTSWGTWSCSVMQRYDGFVCACACVLVHVLCASEILLASLWHNPLILLCTRIRMKKYHWAAERSSLSLAYSCQHWGFKWLLLYCTT